MSELIKHECGIAQLRLLKPLSYYKEKYGTAFWGIDKMYLMLEKQHNRGQDGAGFASIKLDMPPGSRYISRYRSIQPQPIKDVFENITKRISKELELNPEYKNDLDLQKQNIPYLGELMLGHVRYGTYGKNSLESVHPFLRQNNWMHRNLILAGNFNMTNVNELFDNLVKLGQHPKEKADTVTVMEKIGHFLDSEVRRLYKKLKSEGFNKQQASPHIVDQIKLTKILKKSSRDWDGGYVMAGLLGHGDAFVLRDPSGIRPAYYYHDDEIAVVASERPVIQTAFNVPFEKVIELEPGHALITKRDGRILNKQIIAPLEKKACSFERIYFSRGSDVEIYKERKKLGKLIMPEVLEAINFDTKNSVFSYIPNTAETSFIGMVEAANDELNKQKTELILKEKDKLSDQRLKDILNQKLRTEKIAIKDAKLRTFITEDSSRDSLVAHIYDITYGVVKPEDHLVIIDDSIVRGTTLKKSIIKMLDRLGPKQIVVVSSAPQIRYPDCYGIDMAKLEDFIAFRAAIALHKEQGTYKETIDAVYQKCKAQDTLSKKAVENYVKAFYEPFSYSQISNKIAELISDDTVKADVKVIYQTVDNLHLACPENLGDWYFTGNYPTIGGSKIVNKAFINFVEGNKKRAY